MSSSRRDFVLGAIPALALLGSGRELAVQTPAANAMPLDRRRNAGDYAGWFNGTEPRVLTAALPKRIPALGCIYGLAATLENRDGVPQGVAFVKGNSAKKHVPLLWAIGSRVGKGVKFDLAHAGQVAWDLTGKLVWFESSGGAARNISDNETVHNWQSRSFVPRLDSIDSGTQTSSLKQLETHSGVTSLLLLNRGRIETGVPLRETGRSGLFRFAATAEDTDSAPLLQMSDNQLWSFWLPPGSTDLKVWSRELGKPSRKPQLLTTLLSGDTGITFFFSNDLAPGERCVAGPEHADAVHYWQITNRPDNNGYPKFALSAYGHTVPTLVDEANDCDLVCQRIRILLP